MDDEPPTGNGSDESSAPGGGTDVAVRSESDLSLRDPTEIRDPLPQPFFSWRRLVIAGIFAVAIGCLVVAVQSGGGDDETVATDEAIVDYRPDPGSRVPRQSRVGVELAPGYDGRITVDGVAIPEEQMVGAIVPGTEAWEKLSVEQREAGPRPNNKHVVMYQPGDGKAVDEYGTGAVEISVRFWRLSHGPQSARTISYVINVT